MTALGMLGEDEARELLIRELAKDEYQQAKPGLLDEILRRITDWFTDLVNSLQGASPNLGTLFIVVAVLLVIGAAIWLVRPRRNARAAEAGQVFDADQVLSAEEHRRRADAAAARGDWDESCTERFRAVVRSMEERVVLARQPGQTADEAARRIGPAFPALSADLVQAATVFDAVRYGKLPASEADSRAAARLDGQLQATRPVLNAEAPALAVPR
ncbi:DUF4129 domain-containing protein [Arthrobacter mangrovi]|uniref:Protein-glutamine gamma-glutamyltransferase-like C-terminal domain-containing protein n=1 Tax=Arthrobacter mangrovi TaxID=2966350 RepID=A0ABQ5MSF3_9MICC|nr:DUF4129 domain-containing protein [Arthrobacter mangrovi]GLB66922.1 hypothetical protein AHIS1636_13610 [Arthrobacter mangrovi]